MDILLFFFLGASLASFIGVVVERFPEKSLITPASHCQACGTTLPAWDLIPILSFLINCGRCRFCQVKLPIWYLLIECFLGIVSVGYYHHILSGQICMTILLSVLLSLYDLKSLGFPILAWLLPTLGLFFFAPLSPIFLILCLLGILAEMTDIKIGSGDFFYLASLSLGLSLTALLWVIELGSLAGILSYLLKLKRCKHIPLVPFLFLGYLLVILFKLT